METIKYNEIIWDNIKVLNLKKCSEIAQKFITKTEKREFYGNTYCFEV